jgi:membrane associated rhomboid family serine protease
MEKTTSSSFLFERKRMWLALLPSLVFVSLVWLSFLVDHAGLFDSFSQWGIRPGTVSGLKGIIFSPFIHASFNHLISNTLPLLILIWFLFYFYNKIALAVFLLLWVLSGFTTWFIGRGYVHVGASGLVFAILFFLFFSGLFRNHIPLVAVSMIVAFIYGSTVWSIFPVTELVDPSISWEGHLSGAISGLLLAIIFRKQGPQKPPVVWDDETDDETDEEIAD